MRSNEALLALKANPVFQALVDRFQQRRQVYLERLLDEKEPDERLRLSGRCQELKTILNEIHQMLHSRPDLESGGPEAEV